MIDTRTVDVHICRLRKKLKAAPDESELFHTVRGIGYVLKYDPTQSAKPARHLHSIQEQLRAILDNGCGNRKTCCEGAVCYD